MPRKLLELNGNRVKRNLRSLDSITNYTNKKKNVNTITEKELEKILQEPPPKIEKLAPTEIYLVNEETNTKRRICGEPKRKYLLPIFVPIGISNPHKVINPYAEYVCTHSAGRGWEKDIGPCLEHARDKASGSTKKQERKFRDLVKPNRLIKDGIAVHMGQYNEYFKKAVDDVPIRELYDQARPLYEFEALKLMLQDEMQQADNEEALTLIRQFSDIINKSANVRLTLSQADQVLIKNDAIKRLIESLINGMIIAVEEKLGLEQAQQVLEYFREEVLIPIEERGFTEVHMRQKAAGMDRFYKLEDAGEVEAETVE